VTLMNSGGTPLTITSISSSAGFNETNNCGSSVAADGSCVIQVTFAPTAAGPLSGTVSVVDNAPGSPQPVAVSGLGADFAIGLASGSPQSVTISPGATASYSLTATPQGGFNQTITLACAGAPALASCSVSPAVVKIDGIDAVPLMISVRQPRRRSLFRMLPSPQSLRQPHFWLRCSISSGFWPFAS
jgi:hypothetical protein